MRTNKELILATKHDVPPLNHDARFLVDIDLASLGYPEREFNKNTARIRAEYNWVSKETFNRERAKLLQSFLDRPSIYLTEFFHNKYEAQARKNLARAIKQLSE